MNMRRGLRQLARTWDGFGRQDPLWAILSHKEKRGNRWNLEEFLATGQEEIRNVLDYTARHCPGHGGDRALDFGCGVGRLSQALAPTFQRVDGVDISPAMLEQANTINAYGDSCRYHLNEVPNLKVFADESFDFIYSNITLQHMSRPLAHGYIAEMCRVLRPGGALVFDLPERPVRSRSRLGAFLSRSLRWGFLAWNRHIRNRPIMDMFGTPHDRVAALIETTDCKIRHSEASSSAGPDWISRRYCVAR